MTYTLRVHFVYTLYIIYISETILYKSIQHLFHVYSHKINTKRKCVFMSDFPVINSLANLEWNGKSTLKWSNSLQSGETFQYPWDILVYQYFVGYLNMHKKYCVRRSMRYQPSEMIRLYVVFFMCEWNIPKVISTIAIESLFGIWAFAISPSLAKLSYILG